VQGLAMLNKKALAASVSAPPKVFVEDVFSTYLYTGNGSTQTITNGIDLDGEGGLVWIKNRDQNDSHILTDTERGATETLVSNTTAAEATDADTVTAFNSTGFAIGADDKVNTNTENFVSWTFRKKPKFFDIVTYTGNGTAGRTVAHNLGSVPGMMIIKRTNTAKDWCVYHRSTGKTFYALLNTTAPFADDAGDGRWNDTEPTASVFTLGNDSEVNANGDTYVAYLFAHNAGGFGTAGTDNVISCGTYTGNGSATGPVVTLGYEPQWLMIKRATTSGEGWVIIDNMRGMDVNTSGTGDKMLFANTSNNEGASKRLSPTATGFEITDNSGEVNTDGATYIYMAIRRPMKVPTTGTEVFTPATRTGTGTTGVVVTNANFPIDLVIGRNKGATAAPVWIDRLRGATVELRSDNDDAQAASTIMSSTNGLASQNGWVGSTGGTGAWNVSSTNYIQWYFRRAPGFFDEVCYTGTGSNTTQTHNLGVVPELMIVKKRSATDDWAVYAGDNTDFLLLNTTAATADDNTYWNDTSPTSTVFSVGTNADVNTSAATYVAYLFATLAGVSKVGSYTGTAAAQTINCGFTGGARFVLIKRTDSTGDWYVWDTARGIIASDDPYLLINSNAAEVTNTDYVDPVSSGFELSSTAPAAINASGGSFIFFAVA
jgi:hypothetical protein